jgi:hypothetical protein
VELGVFGQFQCLDLYNTNRNGNSASIDLTKSATTLTHLHLHDNDFDAGPVPPWLSSFTRLQLLQLENINRNGNMASIDLTKSATTMTRGNDAVAGPVPPWLSSFTQLQVLQLGE